MQLYTHTQLFIIYAVRVVVTSSGSRARDRYAYIYMSTWPGVHYTDMLLTPGDYPLFSLLFARRSRLSFFRRSPTLAERARYIAALPAAAVINTPRTAVHIVCSMRSRTKETRNGSGVGTPFFFHCNLGTALQYILLYTYVLYLCATVLVYLYIYILFYIRYILHT